MAGHPDLRHEVGGIREVEHAGSQHILVIRLRCNSLIDGFAFIGQLLLGSDLCRNSCFIFGRVDPAVMGELLIAIPDEDPSSCSAYCRKSLLDEQVEEVLSFALFTTCISHRVDVADDIDEPVDLGRLIASGLLAALHG